MILNDKCQWNPTQAFEIDIYPGASITEYGAAVNRVNNAGIQTISMVAAAGADHFIGVALPDSRPVVTRAVVEEATVPLTAPRTVTLKHANLVTGQLSVYDSSGNLLTLTTHYTFVAATGIVTFVDATYAGTTCTFIYRYTMTATEISQVYGSRPVNLVASAAQMTATVIMGSAVIFTDLYDTTVAYTISSSALYTRATGLIASSSTGSPETISTTCHAAVIEAPSINSPYLGFRYQT